MNTLLAQQAKQQPLTGTQRLMLAALVFMVFVMGTTEYIIVGLLSEVAADLNVSVSRAGTLVSGFAIAYAIGTPLVVALITRLPKRAVMLMAAAVLLAANVVSALSDWYPLLLVSRVVAAVACGVFLSLAFTVASAVIPPHRQGMAVSLLLSGFTVANVLGVPLGTYIGQHWGWPAAFWSVAGMCLAALAVNAFVLPEVAGASGGSAREQQLKLLRNPRALVALAIPSFGFAATYTIFTYLSPLLTDVLGVERSSVSLVLLMYGLLSIVSNLAAGRLAGARPLERVRYVLVLHALALLSLAFTGPYLAAGLFSIGAIALSSYLFNAPTQLYALQLAEREYPEAKALAASLNPTAINIGIAVGAVLGGLVTDSLGLLYTPVAGALLAGAALLLAVLGHRLEAAGEKR